MAQPALSSTNDVSGAYEEAKRCFVVNTYIGSELSDAGDAANAKAYEAKAKRAFDLAYFFGNMLKLSRQRVAAELDASADQELTKLVRDKGYLKTAVAYCKTHGLM